MKLPVKQLESALVPTGSTLISGPVTTWSHNNRAAVILPAGTTAERPANPQNGATRKNTDLGLYEGWDATANAWLPIGGGAASLGLPEDGSFTDSRYTGGKPPAAPITVNTSIATAMDSINEILGLLLPNPPTDFAGAALTVSGTAYPLVSGYTDNSGAGPAAGTAINRVTTAQVSTNKIEDRGNGMEGTISMRANGAVVNGESITLTGNPTDAKNSGVLRVTDNKWGGTNDGGTPAPAGFYQTIDAQVVNFAAPVGFNNLRIDHSLSGNTSVATFVRDDLTALPVASAVNVDVGTPGTLVYQSGIAHLPAGATLNVDGTISNVAGQTYLPSGIITITGPGTTVSAAPGQAGLPAVIPANTLTHSFVDQVFTIGGNVTGRAVQIAVRGSNPNGNGNSVNAPQLINIVSGTNGLREMSIPVTVTGNTGNAIRREQGDGRTPVTAPGNWDSAVPTEVYDAAFVGGTLRHDVTDYTGYLPSGPNYTGHNADQYVTLRFNAPAKSGFKIVVAGNYAECFVKLPGIDTADMPNAVNGWWSMQHGYIGSGAPGRTGDANAGCASGAVMTGNGGTFGVTFGTKNSTFSTGNAILVRFRMTAGQVITALSFTD